MVEGQVRSRVARFLTAKLDESDKSQKEVAEACGYDKPNIITMFKQGLTKLPINKVGPMAIALGVDPVHLFRLTMEEYLPETWEAIQGLTGRTLITQGEFDLIQELRRLTGDAEIQISEERQREALHALASALAKASV